MNTSQIVEISKEYNINLLKLESEFWNMYRNGYKVLY